MMASNPWHSVPLKRTSEASVQAIIEIPTGSKNKYELDKDTGMLVLDRVLTSSVVYPTNYGFLPQTYCEDGDPLDVLVLSQLEIPPMCLVRVRIIGVMGMVDGGEPDDKLLAVVEGDPQFAEVDDISAVHSHILTEITHFFKTYKDLDNKAVEVRDWQGKAAALKILDDSITAYETKKDQLIDA